MMTDAQFPPRDSCDCHVHVVGPKQRFSFIPDRAYTPMDALRDDLVAMLARLHVDRVVLIQPSVYGTDNACMMEAIDSLAGRARGVAVVEKDIGGSELDDLHRRGVRGLRLNIATSGSGTLDTTRHELGATAALCARNGWHVQTFLPATMIEPLGPTLSELAVPVVIDHFGLVAPDQIDSPAAAQLMRLLQTGRTWVKVSGAYRIADDPAHPGIGPLARKLASVNPERLVWGSDWPHTPAHKGGRVSSEEEMPYRDLDTAALLALVETWFEGDARMIEGVLVHNPAQLYGF